MSTLTIQVSEIDHSLGFADAPITLVEYGDLECPDCGEAYPIIKKWQSELGEKLHFVFRQMPLDQLYPIHPHATKAAIALEAAGKQGKFWEMHDMLYENQEHFEDEDLVSYAKKLGLDIEHFEADILDEKIHEFVAKSVESGKASGVTSTPGFFVNGEFIKDSRNYAELGNYLKELAK